MLVEDWMSEKVIGVRGEDSPADVRTLLAKHRIRQVPVLHRGQLVGIVTDRDLREVSPDTARVDDLMTYAPHTTAADNSVDSAAHLMRRWKINALPVVEAKKVVGVITTSDVLDAFVAFSGVSEPSYRLVLLPSRGAATDTVRALIERQHAEVRWMHSRGRGAAREIHIRLVAADLGRVEDALEAAGHSVSCVVASSAATPLRKK